MSVAFENIARNYLHASADYLLEFADGDRVLQWPTGETIAYRQQLVGVLKPLRGVVSPPPFLSVMLLMSALRDNWGECSRLRATLMRIVTDARSAAIDNDDSQSPAQALFKDTWQKLLVLNEIPDGIRNSTAGKSELMAYLFPSQERKNEVIDSLLMWAENGFSQQVELARSNDIVVARKIERTIWFLQLVLRDFKIQDFVDFYRQGAGLPLEVEELDLPKALRTRGLMEELENESKYAPIASSARQLLSLLSFPRRIEQENELRDGGISDISNRGPLDRLLLSELANDGLTLATRIALGEALYYERESPPLPPSNQRVIMLDNSVFLWGRPRFVQASAALAIAAQSSVDVVSFRLIDDEFVELDLTSRSGFESLLESYEANSNLIAAWGNLPQESTVDEHAELVWLTDKTSWNDPVIRNAILSNPCAPEFVGVCERSGKFSLFQVNLSGQIKIVSSELSFDPVQPKAGSDHSRRKQYERWPRTAWMELPIRVCHPVDWRKTWNVGSDKRISLTNDCRVMVWDDPARFARQCTGFIPFKRLSCAQTKECDGKVAAVVYKNDKFDRLLIDLESETVDAKPMIANQYRFDRFSIHGSTIFGISDFKIAAWNRETLEGIGHAELSKSMQHISGRIVRRGSEYFALSVNGGIELVSICKHPEEHYLQIFECPSLGEFFCRDFKGRISRVSDAKVIVKESGFLSVISNCGRFVKDHNQYWDLSTGHSFQRYTDGPSPYMHWLDEQYLKKVKRAGIHNGKVYLETFRGKCFCLELANNNTAFWFALCGEYQRPPGDCFVELNPNKERHDLGRLRFVAGELGYGRSIWMDSRGLLHLTGAESGEPDFAVLLRVDSNPPGFMSDGEVWGGQEYADSAGGTTPSSRVIHRFSQLTRDNSTNKGSARV